MIVKLPAGQTATQAELYENWLAAQFEFATHLPSKAVNLVAQVTQKFLFKQFWQFVEHESQVLVFELGKKVLPQSSTQTEFNLNVGTWHRFVLTDETTHPPNPLSLNPSGHPPNMQAPFW